MKDMPLEIANFFLAMQAGRAGADRLAACFAEEPWTTERITDRGREALRRAGVSI